MSAQIASLVRTSPGAIEMSIAAEGLDFDIVFELLFKRTLVAYKTKLKGVQTICQHLNSKELEAQVFLCNQVGLNESRADDVGCCEFHHSDFFHFL